jgi:hypothetical protein
MRSSLGLGVRTGLGLGVRTGLGLGVRTGLAAWVIVTPMASARPSRACAAHLRFRNGRLPLLPRTALSRRPAAPENRR